MGLFILDLEEPHTKNSRVKAAVANLELYLQELNGVNENDYDHLLIIAQGYLDDALKEIEPGNIRFGDDYDNLTRDDLI